MTADSTTRPTRLFDGDTFTREGITFRVKMDHDYDMGPPWEEGDDSDLVSDWTTRPKAPGERVLNRDRGSYRYYNFAEAVKRYTEQGRDPYAKGWRSDLGEDATLGQVAARIAELNFIHYDHWCRDLWQWMVLSVEMLTKDGGTVGSEHLGGVSSEDHATITEEAWDMAGQLIEDLVGGSMHKHYATIHEGQIKFLNELLAQRLAAGLGEAGA